MNSNVASNSNAPANNNSTRKNNANQMGGQKMYGGQKMMGGAKMPAVGTKAQVFHGTAKHTSGGLTRKDLMKTKKGRIVSRRKHAAGKKALSRLRKAGFKAKKGTFKLFKK